MLLWGLQLEGEVEKATQKGNDGLARPEVCSSKQTLSKIRNRQGQSEVS